MPSQREVLSKEALTEEACSESLKPCVLRLSEECKHNTEGQSTVEYVLISLVLVALVLALMALVRFGEAGGFARLAVYAASHAVLGWELQGLLNDVFVF